MYTTLEFDISNFVLYLAHEKSPDFNVINLEILILDSSSVKISWNEFINAFAANKVVKYIGSE